MHRPKHQPNGLGGSNYSWAGPNSFTAATATIGISNANTNNAGVYTVTVSNGNCTATATANVTVNTTPTAAIAGTTTYCTGQSISLTASGEAITAGLGQ
ncbi:MAG: hypothetical protein U0Y10_23215 [Spirosomataceae bacterium]